VRRLRVERTGRPQHAGHVVEGAADRLAQPARQGGRRHPAARPDQQGIAEQVAQPAERARRRRLAEPDRRRRAGDVLRLEQGVEDDQEIEVDPGEGVAVIHGVDTCHQEHSLAR
jgi:hypothetical protein